MWSTAEVKDGIGGRGRSASGDVSVEEDNAALGGRIAPALLRRVRFSSEVVNRPASALFRNPVAVKHIMARWNR